MAEYFNNYEQNTKTNTQRAAKNEIKNVVNDFNPRSSNDNALLQTSTNIFVYANGSIVGMIQSFQVTENRTINKLQAIGYEGVVQAVPSNTQGGQLSVTRIALYESNLWTALGLTTSGKPYNPLGSKVHSGDAGNDWDVYEQENQRQSVPQNLAFKTLKDQRVPLEIEVKTPQVGDRSAFYIEKYVDCWLSSYSKSYNVGTITVAEQAQIQYADVHWYDLLNKYILKEPYGSFLIKNITKFIYVI